MKYLTLATSAILFLSSCADTNGTTSSITSLPIAESSSQLKVMWNRNIGPYSEFLRPTHNNNIVCSANKNGDFYLLRKADGGDALPPFRLQAASAITATGCGSGVAAVATNNGVLLVYDYEGNELWRKDLNTRLIASPLANDGSVFMLGQDNRLSAYTARYGDLLWRYVLPRRTLLRTPVDSALVTKNGLIYAGMGNGSIVALQQDNGKVKWQTKLSFASESGVLANILDITTPVVQGDRLCAVAYQGHIGCLHPRNGQLLWRKPLSAAKRVTMDEHRVFAVDINGSLIAYNADDGELLWRQELKTAKTVAFVRDAVIVGFADGTLAALAVDDGRTLSSVDLNGEVVFLQPLNAEEVLGTTLSGDIFLAAFAF